MRRMLIAGLWTGLMASSAWSQDIAVVSKIDAVTVYPLGADVSRIASINVPQGGHRLLLTGLPAGIDPQSIRVEGTGTGKVEISSVDARDSYIGASSPDAERLSLTKQIATLGDERALLDTVIADSNHQRTFLLGLADKQLSPQSTDSNSRDINVVALGGLLDLVGQKLASLAEAAQHAQVRQREIDEQVNDLSTKLNMLHANDKHQTDLAINVAAVQNSALNLKVSYRVDQASWQPSYDARLNIGSANGPAKLALDRQAVVSQTTDEEWQDVALVLSTAMPTGLTAAPEIQEVEVGLPPMPVGAAQSSLNVAPAAESDVSELKAEAGALDKRKDADQDAYADVPANQLQAEIVQAGFQANYVIGGRANVDNSGQAKKLSISSSMQDVQLTAVVAPRMDVTAYLTAEFASDAAGPQLAGPVNLYRDGVYVGLGHLPQLAPKEKATLGFGADDLVKVTRAEVKRLAGDEGIISTSHVEERAWDIVVANLHDFALPVIVKDRVPFTSAKTVTITEIPGMTEPTTRNVDRKRGVLAWQIAVEPGSESTIKTGYKISWTGDVQLGSVD